MLCAVIVRAVLSVCIYLQLIVSVIMYYSHYVQQCVICDAPRGRAVVV